MLIASRTKNLDITRGCRQRAFTEEAEATEGDEGQMYGSAVFELLKARVLQWTALAAALACTEIAEELI